MFKTNSIFDIEAIAPKALNEYIRFRTHPLVAIEHFIQLRNTDNDEHYPRWELFDNFPAEFGDVEYNRELSVIQDVHVPNYENMLSLANSAIEYYTNERTMRALQGVPRSEWLDKLSVAFEDMKQNRLRLDHLAAVCKLIPLYLFDKKVMDISEQYDVADVQQGFPRVFVHKLKFIEKMRPVTSEKRHHMCYLFLNSKNHLVRVDVHDKGFRDSIEVVLKLNNNEIMLDLSCSKRIIYNNNKNLLVTDKILGVSI